MDKGFESFPTHHSAWPQKVCFDLPGFRCRDSFRFITSLFTECQFVGREEDTGHLVNVAIAAIASSLASVVKTPDGDGGFLAHIRFGEDVSS